MQTRKRPPAAGIGKKKGTVNHTTAVTREMISAFLERNSSLVQELWAREAKRRPGAAVKLWIELADFVLPRMQRIEMNVSAQPAFNSVVSDPSVAMSAYEQIVGRPDANLEGLTFAESIVSDVPAQDVIDPLPALPNAAADVWKSL